MWKLATLSDTAIRVLEVILLHMDFKDRTSYPTQDLICKESGILTLATISRSVKELVTKGVITIGKRKGEYRHYPYNVYTVQIFSDNKLFPPKSGRRVEETVSLLDKEAVDDIIRKHILFPDSKQSELEE